MRVQWHLEDRRDAAGGRAARARFPTFPVRSTGLIEMHMRVYNAGKYNKPGSFDGFAFVTTLGTDRGDHAILDRDVHRALARGQNDPTPPNDERPHPTSSLT